MWFARLAHCRRQSTTTGSFGAFEYNPLDTLWRITSSAVAYRIWSLAPATTKSSGFHRLKPSNIRAEADKRSCGIFPLVGETSRANRQYVAALMKLYHLIHVVEGGMYTHCSAPIRHNLSTQRPSAACHLHSFSRPFAVSGELLTAGLSAGNNGRVR